MKGIRKIVVGVLVLTFLLSLAGCMPMQSKTEQFTDGLVRLMSTPLDMLADAEEPTYSDDLVGELLELTNTRSHNTSASLQIERLSGIESMGFGLGMLSGARFDFESAYDVETGDGVTVADPVGVSVHSGVSVGSTVGVSVGPGVSVISTVGVDVGPGVSVAAGVGLEVDVGVHSSNAAFGMFRPP